MTNQSDAERLTEIRPTYYVRHPDGDYSIALPQPSAATLAMQDGTYAQCDQVHAGSCCPDPNCRAARAISVAPAQAARNPGAWVVPTGMHVTCPTAPERIWMQTDPECASDEPPQFPHDDLVTWCRDRIYKSDTLYIRADLSAAPDAPQPEVKPLPDADWTITMRRMMAADAEYESWQSQPTGTEPGSFNSQHIDVDDDGFIALKLPARKPVTQPTGTAQPQGTGGNHEAN